MIALVALHFCIAAVSPVLIRIFDRRAFYFIAAVPAAAFLWLVLQGRQVISGHEIVSQFDWIPVLGVSIAFRLTTLNWIMALLVTGIGALILLYCTQYFKPRDPNLWRFSGIMVAFAGTMLGLVISDDLVVLYVFWEATTILSYLLIGHNPERKANRRAAMNALLITTFGGLAMLIGIVMLGQHAGTYRVSAVFADPASGTFVSVAVYLLLIGALTKSALIPFHFWLPGAMAAPTPVSAYLHAAAMVKAGVYLVALMAPSSALIPGWRATVIVLGLGTMVLGGLRALRQYDIKLLLAYSTVSQLGFLIAVAGIGTRNMALAAIAMLCAHAFFKSALFLVVGIIDRRLGTRDLRLLSGLRRTTPTVLFISTVVAAASMAGLPPLIGFVAKEAIFGAALELSPVIGRGAMIATVAGFTFGSLLTAAYTARFVWGVYGDKRGVADCAPRQTITVSFLAPAAILAACSLVFGFLGGSFTTAVQPYLEQFSPTHANTGLALWHGLGLPLLLSTIAIAGGLVLFVRRRPIATMQHSIAERLRLPDTERGYYSLMRAIDKSAVEVTGATQRGSLPIYLSVTLLVFVVLVGGAALMSGVRADYYIADSVAQIIIGAIVALAAIGTVRSRRRLRAVLLAGVTGYGTAMLFMLHGAPDLALTQVLIETVTLVVFVLVLRRLPSYFSDRPLTRARFFRASLGLATGIVVAAAGLIAASVRSAEPVSVAFPDLAQTLGGGLNVVNVTLVDIRAWDTMGELSVLVVAATGVASLIFLITSRSARIRTVAQRNVPTRFTGRTFLRSGQAMDPDQRSLVFEVVTRIIFHPIILFSLYLALSGHNAPGGGFAGGLVAGLALMVRYMTGGRLELDEAAPVDAGHVLGAGLAVAAGSALVPMLVGGEPLQSAIIDVSLGPLGQLHVVTSAVFDFGVYLVVVGLMLDILRSLGGGIDRQGEESEETPQTAVMQ